MQLSEEQSAYIHYLNLEDTKLLATAGSGKTFSIIQRIHYLIESGKITKDNVILLTFSKHAREDFANKLKSNNIATYDKNNVFTIDSFALRMLGTHAKNIDVSVLSYAFYVYLDQRLDRFSAEALQCMQRITDIFVDEAQDLNQTQFNIISAMQSKFGSRIHMIGDPNQNIYQFRNSSDKYLVNFAGKIFRLSTNYRSYKHIVEFSNHLRPYQDTEVKYSKESKHDMKVTFYAPRCYSEFESSLIHIINRMRHKNVKLDKLAILAPTRGQLRDKSGNNVYKGLCYISHILYENKIPFKQFYSDFASDDSLDDASKQNYKPTYNHVNLLTMTSSKGLEWDYVILVDANAFLIGGKNYDCDKYNAEQYLLYVAASRAKKNLIIYTSKDKANPWFAKVPRQLYKIDDRTAECFKFYDKELFYTHKMDTDAIVKTVTQMVKTLREDELFAITERISFMLEKTTLIGSDNWKLKIPPNRAVLMGCVMEHILYVYLTQMSQEHTQLLIDLNNAVTSKNIISCSNEFIIRWYYNNRNTLTWELYDERLTKGEIPKSTSRFIDQYFNRDTEFSAFTVIDKYYDIFIRKNMSTIKKRFLKYIANPENFADLFYVTTVNYAIRTTHYYYIEQVDDFYKDLIGSNNACDIILQQTKSFIPKFFRGTVFQVQEHVSNDRFHGIIDILADKQIYEVKCSKSIRISDLLQTLVYNILLDDDLTEYKLNILNMEDGSLNEYRVLLHKTDRDWLLDLLWTRQN